MKPYALLEPGGKRYCADIIRETMRGFLPQHPVDVILLSAAWSYGDVGQIADTVAYLKRYARRVIVVGPIPVYTEALPTLLARSLLQKSDQLVAAKAIDVWYLVSLSGLFRQAARNQSSIDQGKRDAINRMLGTQEWEREWYRSRETDLFGEINDVATRGADVDAMQSFVARRLESLFPKVCKPLRLNTDRNVPSFALFFAISNPEPKAIGLATKIADHILASGNSSQKRSL